MKIKTILVGNIIVLLVFLIYLTTLDKKVYYLSLGDSLALGQTPYGNLDYGYTDYIKDYLKDKKILEKHINEFSAENHRITDLIRDIEDNKKIYINNKPQTIKNALIKADLITLSIGLDEIIYKLGNIFNDSNVYSYIDEVMEDMNKLLSLIKEYCKEDIIVLGYYLPILYSNDENSRQYIEYANKKLEDLCNFYSIHFIKLDTIMHNNSEYLPNPLDFHPSKVGYEATANEIIKKINQTLLK